MKPNVLRKRLIPAYWLIGVVAVAAAGTRPNPANHVQLFHTYPTEDVLFILCLMTIESLMLNQILMPATYQRSWSRSGFAAGFWISLTFIVAVGLMHAPPFMYWHFLWLVVGELTLLILFVTSVISAALARADVQPDRRGRARSKDQ